MTSTRTLNVDGTDTLPLTVRIGTVLLRNTDEAVTFSRNATGYTITYSPHTGDVLVQSWRAATADRMAIRDAAETLLTAAGFAVTRCADYTCEDGTVLASSGLLVTEA